MPSRDAADRRWNHNLHYHRRVLAAVPLGARSALDVGTGDGLLARDLHRIVPQVTAVDVDSAVLERARALDPGVRWVRGDVMRVRFDPRGFDVVASVAALHHLPDPVLALTRLRELTAPGGVLVVVGLARSTTALDLLMDLVGAVEHRLLVTRFGYWQHSAPVVWPPPHSYSEVRAAARAALPGVIWRRLPFWRYLIVWRRPPA